MSTVTYKDPGTQPTGWVANKRMTFLGEVYNPGDAMPDDVESSQAFRALVGMDHIVPNDGSKGVPGWASRNVGSGHRISPAAAATATPDDTRLQPRAEPEEVATEEDVEVATEEDIDIDLENLSVPALKDILRERGLPVSGNKAALVERIQNGA